MDKFQFYVIISVFPNFNNHILCYLLVIECIKAIFYENLLIC